MGHPFNGIFSLIFLRMKFWGLHRDCFGKVFGVKTNTVIKKIIKKKQKYNQTPDTAKSKNLFIKILRQTKKKIKKKNQ